jgi:hypothetical protein
MGQYIGKLISTNQWVESDSIWRTKAEILNSDQYLSEIVYLPGTIGAETAQEDVDNSEVYLESLGEDTWFSDLYSHTLFTGDIISIVVNEEIRYFLVKRGFVDREVVPYGGGEPFLAAISGIIFTRRGQAFLPATHNGIIQTANAIRVGRAYDIIKEESNLLPEIIADIRNQIGL